MNRRATKCKAGGFLGPPPLKEGDKMNNMDPRLMIAITEAESAAKKEKTLIGRLKAAMRATKDHWMLTDEDGRFRAAVGAAMLLSDEETQGRIKRELTVLKTLSAAMNGVPVDFSAMSDIEEPIGLIKIWNEVKAENG